MTLNDSHYGLGYNLSYNFFFGALSFNAKIKFKSHDEKCNVIIKLQVDDFVIKRWKIQLLIFLSSE